MSHGEVTNDLLDISELFAVMSDGEKCILCTVCLMNMRTECPFSFVFVYCFQEESVVIDVNGDFFLSRCLTMVLPCMH